jgi:hypothetical protein
MDRENIYLIVRLIVCMTKNVKEISECLEVFSFHPQALVKNSRILLQNYRLLLTNRNN